MRNAEVQSTKVEGLRETNSAFTPFTEARDRSAILRAQRKQRPLIGTQALCQVAECEFGEDTARSTTELANALRSSEPHFGTTICSALPHLWLAGSFIQNRYTLL